MLYLELTNGLMLYLELTNSYSFPNHDILRSLSDIHNTDYNPAIPLSNSLL